jgi:hypothetical protein
MTDLHPWQVSTKLQPPIESSILFRLPSAGEEVLRLDKDGFHYRGQFIKDAGEAHRLMVEFLRQGHFPQPPSLKEQALEALREAESTGCLYVNGRSDLIRKALEALPND